MEIMNENYSFFLARGAGRCIAAGILGRSAASSRFPSNFITHILFVQRAQHVTRVFLVSLKLVSSSSSLSLSGSTVVDSAACWVMRESTGRYQMLPPLASFSSWWHRQHNFCRSPLPAR